jgi:multidrug efflux pump subunit AcrA (membrane-fusion protein)
MLLAAHGVGSKLFYIDRDNTGIKFISSSIDSLFEKYFGSDALKPDALNQAYRFPATVSLDKQRVESGGKPLNLQSGMSVTANIKLRSRPVITIVSDMFTKQLEGVKRFR